MDCELNNIGRTCKDNPTDAQPQPNGELFGLVKNMTVMKIRSKIA